MRTTTTSITFLAFFVGLSLSVANADPVEFAVFANANKINEVCTPDGMGMGDFPVCTDIGAATFNSLAVALGDVNNDGTPDAVFGGPRLQARPSRSTGFVWATRPVGPVTSCPAPTLARM